MLIANTVERHRSIKMFRREFRALVEAHGARYAYLPTRLDRDTSLQCARDARARSKAKRLQWCKDVCAADACDHGRDTFDLDYRERCEHDKYRLCTVYGLSDVTEPAFVERFGRREHVDGFRSFVAALADDEYTFARWMRDKAAGGNAVFHALLYKTMRRKTKKS